jgi:CRP/FNR family transcriptional regulator, cyclic AMP receptor protein
MGHRLPALAEPLSLLSPEDLDDLVALGSFVTHAAGELLVHQGGRDRCVHVLVEGSVKVVVTAADGRAVLLEFCRAGETIGELSVLDGRPRSADVVATERVRSLRIDGDAFVAFLHDRPSFALALLQLVSGRLRDANVTRLELALEPTLQRVARRVLELAASHGAPTEEGLTVAMPVTQAELADWVGASREGVSDALRHLRARGAIATGRRKLVILDVEGLRWLAGG